MVEIKQSLRAVLKRMRLSGVLPTLPDRVAYANKVKLNPQDFLELVLQDEIERRDNKGLECRLKSAGFDEIVSFDEIDWDAPVTFDRDRVRDLFNLGFLDRCEDVIFMGPVGVGKTIFAAALGHAACRAGHRVLFIRSDRMLRELHQSRADNSHERALRKLLAVDLLIIDDFGLRSLDIEQSSDCYEVIIERHHRSSTIITSNRAVDEWIPLFDDGLLAQSAFDRLAHNAHQIVMEGESYRRLKRVGQRQEAGPRPKKRPLARGRRLK